MSKLTRTLKFQVSFPGMTEEQLTGTKGLWYRLVVMQNELSRAANRLGTALFSLRQGVIPCPEKDGKKVSERTLSYQGMNGTWKPFGFPLYTPQRTRVSSGLLLGTAGLVYTRITTDYKDIVSGKKSLATFTHIPLIAAGQSVKIDEESGRISFPLAVGDRIDLQPCKIDGSKQSIWSKILSGEYKHGDAKLFRNLRKKKWFMSLSWSGQVEERPSGGICGVDLGMVITAMLGFLDSDLQPTKRYVAIRIPENVLRAWDAAGQDRRQRQLQNKEVFGLREGKGKQRKLRAADRLSSRRSNMVRTAVQQTASAVVKEAIRNGCSKIAIEDLTGFTEEVIAGSEDQPTRSKAWKRKWFLTWNQGAMRLAIKSAAGREGIACIEVNPSYTSRTCHVCGKVWQKPEGGNGRVSQKDFRCTCGFSGNADWNAALNIAKRAA